MTTQKSKNEVFVVKHLRSALGSPTETELSTSRERVKKWFAEEAPLIQWGEMSSPLGPLFAAVNERGLCALDFRAEGEGIFATLRSASATREKSQSRSAGAGAVARILRR